MSIFYPSFDPNSPPALDDAMVDQIIASPQRTASDLLVLYFTSLLPDLDGAAGADGTADARANAVSDRIANALADLAHRGDDDAAMALRALEEISAADNPPETKAVAIAMFEQVALKPILRDAISGDLDHATAADGIAAVKSFAEMLLADVFETEDADQD